MQSIAMENNLAETAFVVPQDSHYDIRWFTPTHEAPFCGHATLASAHILMTQYKAQGPLTFQTKTVGQLKVTNERDAYTLDLPSLEPETIDIDLEETLGVKPVTTFRNFENLFAVFDSTRSVREFTPNMEKIAKLDFGGLGITARGDSADDPDFVSRYFAPQNGIPEDPVTGSTHSTLVPYWARELGKNLMVAHQVSPRGGHLQCTAQTDRVLLGGNAVTFMEATIWV